MDDHFYISELIARKIKGEISSEGDEKISAWLKEHPENKKLYKKIITNEHIITKAGIYELFDKEYVWSSIENKLFETKTRKLSIPKLMRYATAVLLPLILLSGLYFGIYRQGNNPLAQIDEHIQPGEQKAILILSDGIKIDLQQDSIQKNIMDGETLIAHQNNALTYTPKEAIKPLQPLIYNELITPRGGKYVVTLPDGTKVWLNADSRLRYPIAFSDSIRKVVLEGEAYFDVQQDKKPFIVHAGQLNTRVLGTEFNIMAYEDEDFVVNTLVEGIVEISAGNLRRQMLPGDQTTLIKKGNRMTVQKVNTDLYTSWVNGKIEFSNEDLHSVMRRLARWYDFDFVFEDQEAKGYHFTGRIDNNQNISSILEMLQMTTDVTFEYDRKTIHINPN